MLHRISAWFQLLVSTKNTAKHSVPRCPTLWYSHLDGHSNTLKYDHKDRLRTS